MRIPTFDIFSGESDKNAVWIESVEGLGAACERMQNLAAETPGPYFVFHAESHMILASVDTTSKTKAESDVA